MNIVSVSLECYSITGRVIFSAYSVKVVLIRGHLTLIVQPEWLRDSSILTGSARGSVKQYCLFSNPDELDEHRCRAESRVILISEATPLFLNI